MIIAFVATSLALALGHSGFGLLEQRLLSVARVLQFRFARRERKKSMRCLIG